MCKCTNEKIPYFNAPVYLENKSQIGKVDDIFGPMTDFVSLINWIRREYIICFGLSLKGCGYAWLVTAENDLRNVSYYITQGDYSTVLKANARQQQNNLGKSTLVCQLSLVLQVIHWLAYLIDVINSDKSWWQEP